MKENADGPYRGSASKDLEMVEFADFQCPHCKEAQANMDKLVADFPKARIVSRTFPFFHPSTSRNSGCLRHLRQQAGGSSASSNTRLQFSMGRMDWQPLTAPR